MKMNIQENGLLSPALSSRGGEGESPVGLLSGSVTGLSGCLVWVPIMILVGRSLAAESLAGQNPADHLPAHITQVTWFGERADWSHEGKRILFLSKTFGDAMELDVPTKRIRNLTAHYAHCGYTRALYLRNGDVLLSSPETFDAKRIGEARVQCWLSVLDKSGSKAAVSLGTKCSEGPAVSRSRM